MPPPRDRRPRRQRCGSPRPSARSARVRVPLVEGEDDVVAHAVYGRVVAREEGGVRRTRQGNGGGGVLEADASGREGVQVGRLGSFRAVGPDVVRAEGIDGDDHEVGAAGPPAREPEGPAANTAATARAMPSGTMRLPRRDARDVPVPSRGGAASRWRGHGPIRGSLALRGHQPSILRSCVSVPRDNVSVILALLLTAARRRLRTSCSSPSIPCAQTGLAPMVG